MDPEVTALFDDAEGPDSMGALYELVVDLTGDAVYQLDADGRVVAVNENAVELLGRERDAILGTSAEEFLDEADNEAVNEAIAAALAGDVAEPITREVTMYGADGERFPCELRLGLLRRDGEFAGTIGIARDVTDRRRRERALERQRDQLARLDRINRIVRGVARALVRATSRSEVESAVCDRLTRSNTYRHAWIGEPDRTSGVVRILHEGSVPEGLLVDEDRTDECEDCLVHRAARTGAVQTGAPADCALLNAGALAEAGVEAMACVPLEYDRRSYGVLVVYADDERAFDARELSVLDELGATVANALHGTELRQALASDTFVELTLESSCHDQYFVALSDRAGTTVEWEGVVAGEDGTVRYYVTVEDDDPSVAEALAEEFERVVRVTVVSEFDDAYLLEVTVDGDELISTLGPVGAQISELRATEGHAVGRIELPDTARVRETIERVGDVLEDLEVTAQREVRRPRETRRQFRANIHEQLTDRQRTVLETAYYNGFFEWPRASTGEDVADRLDIAPATFHYHLRAAEETVVGEALGDDG